MNTDLADQLRLLAYVERTGTLAASAGILGVTPAAASQRLAKAERDWGIPLVTRSKRGAQLTDAGAVLAPFGEEIDRQLVAARDAFDAHAGITAQRLRIGGFQAATLHLLPPAMTALRHRFPEADLSVVDTASDHAVETIARGELDLAVFATWDVEPEPAAGVEVRALMADPMVIVLPDDHRLAGDAGAVGLRDLSKETWVVMRSGLPARLQFDNAARSAGFEPVIRFETASYEVAQALVGAGMAVAAVSRLAMSASAGVTQRPLVKPRLHRTIYIAVASHRRESPLIEYFIACLQDLAAELLDDWGNPDPVR